MRFLFLLLACGLAAEEPVTLPVFYPGEGRLVTIPLTWNGAADLTITDIRPTCRCLTVFEPPAAIPAGGTVGCEAHLDSTGFTSHFRADLQLTGTSAGVAVEHLVRAIGEVRDPLRWPAGTGTVLHVLKGQLGAGQPVTAAIPLGRGDHPSPWTQLAVAVDDPTGTVAAEVLQGEGDAWTVILTTRLGAVAGITMARLRFSLSLADGSLMSYAPQRLVRVEVQGPWSARPGAVLLAGCAPESVTIRRLRLHAAAEGVAAKITAVRTSAPWLMARLEEDQHGPALEVTITAPAAGNFSERIDVEAADGTHLRIPCFGWVQPAAPP